MNLGAYFFSDQMALAMSGAKPISESEAPQLYQMVRELTTRAGLPMPRLYVIPQDQPNAFATGRNPQARGGRGDARASQPARPTTSCAACSPTSSPTSATATS